MRPIVAASHSGKANKPRNKLSPAFVQPATDFDLYLYGSFYGVIVPMKYVLLIVLCAGVAVPITLRSGSERQVAWEQIQSEITSRLISPGTASFGNQTADELSQDKDGLGWIYFGYVDATNRMGGTERITVLVAYGSPGWMVRFTWPDGRCSVWDKETPNGHHWVMATPPWENST
jgi:hypothetical protein